MIPTSPPPQLLPPPPPTLTVPILCWNFVGKCGGTEIFKVPIMSAVHPNRPPSFEARPHPHKQSQIRRFFELDNCGLELRTVD
ncbi:hypothetical protein YC2023_060097 [Brassica napus]